jgi:hypothetical protein
VRIAYIYLLVCDDKFKIGKASDIESRYHQLKKHYSFNLANSYSIEVPDNEVFKLEKTLHFLFDEYRIKDLPQAEGSTEFFKLDCLNDVLSMLDKISKQKDLIIEKGIMLRPKLVESKKNIKLKKTKRKAKLIHINPAWEEAIDTYLSGGTISGYITLAIREQMQRDGIL